MDYTILRQAENHLRQACGGEPLADTPLGTLDQELMAVDLWRTLPQKLRSDATWRMCQNAARTINSTPTPPRKPRREARHPAIDRANSVALRRKVGRGRK